MAKFATLIDGIRKDPEYRFRVGRKMLIQSGVLLLLLYGLKFFF